MRLPVLLLPLTLLCTTLPASAAKPVKHKASSSHHSARSTHASTKRVSARGSHGKSASKKTTSGDRFGARAPMDSARATQIQTALIKSGYLQGEPTGSWDASSMAAMQKLQSDNGWQTKIVPDSRALIKLGLGPGAATTPTPTPNP